MAASPSVQNVIFGSQSVKRARTGPDGLLTTLAAATQALKKNKCKLHVININAITKSVCIATSLINDGLVGLKS